MSVIKNITTALGIATALSVSLVPLATTFAEGTTSRDAVVTINVPGQLSMTITHEGTDPSADTNVAPGASDSSKVSVISVSGNSNYRVSVADKDTNNALTSAGNSIAAFSTPQASLSSDGWGLTTTAAYGTNKTGSFTAGTYLGVPVSTGTALTVVQTSDTAARFTDDITKMRYGVKVPISQTAGSYSDTITYTLSAV